MAAIVISDLRLTGSELLTDSESFLDFLNDSEVNDIHGGLTPIVIWGIAVASEYVISAMASGAVVGVTVALTK